MRENKPLNCNGCTLCCHGDAIRKLKNDSDDLQWVPHEHYPDELMLDHKPNGDCVYMMFDGCSLHGSDKKPTQCQGMDCRRVALNISKDYAKKHGIIKVYKRGIELAKRDRFKLEEKTSNPD